MGGRCLRSCSKQRRQPAAEAAAHLTLRSGRIVPAGPKVSRSHGRGAAGSGAGWGGAKAADSARGCRSAAARSQRRRPALGSQLSGGRPEELPPPPNPIVRDDGCEDDQDRQEAPLTGEVLKHEHENKVAACRPSPSPLEGEIEAFFAAAELAERRRFAETYNYDVALDRPLEGRFEWAPVST
ncbi:cyclin-dependent kinase inhibitor 3-like [Phragmites australis]|uniref:cyclin-dependent kinase inhibitor 3-like n=1 Tax=Phragmites australis TaxID=29695 RepID=UPI002D77CC62|nr:cyclin-dependent kinase inhibitor 3-like [Phragmites australis]